MINLCFTCQHTAINETNQLCFLSETIFFLPLQFLLGTCRLEHIKQAWRRGFVKKFVENCDNLRCNEITTLCALSQS